MIYLYGDVHRDETNLLKQLNDDYSNDILIILGDFGACWYDDERDTQWIDRFEQRMPFKEILFVDGNHENHKMLYNLKTTTKYENEVGVLSKKTFHLKRGRKYVIDNKSFFVLGGAESTDKAFRILDFDYWQEELPSREEYEIAFNTLEENDYTFDYILSHCTAYSVQLALDKYVISKSPLNNFFEIALSKLKYKHWYFGHYHLDKTVDEYKASCLYRKLIKLNDSLY